MGTYKFLSKFTVTANVTIAHGSSIHSLPMQHLSTPAQIVVPMARLLLGFGVLAFPLTLPFVVSSFFTDNDEEGLSNEKMWARERNRRLSVGALGSRSQNLHIHHTIVLLQCTSSEILPSTLSSSTWHLEVVEEQWMV